MVKAEITNIMNLNEQETMTLIIFNVVDLIQWILLLAFLIHNTISFLFRMKIKNKLIIAFYVLAYVVVIFKMIETIDRALKPKEYYYDYDEISWVHIASSIGETANVAICCLMVATMYELAISI